ncbi:unnamed protein product [Discosporangium mesarthrocarpum]
MTELNGLLEAGAFSFAPLPPGRKAIGAKWVFKWKTNEEGIVVRYPSTLFSLSKARLLAKGFRQREAFAPTPFPAAVRLLAAMACELDLEIVQFDIQQAFIQPDIDVELTCVFPLGAVSCLERFCCYTAPCMVLNRAPEPGKLTL